jgi:hypothetical protein
VKGDHFDNTHAQKHFFLDASSFEKVLNELFHQVIPVRSTLKSVDGLGAVDTRKNDISYTTCSVH